MNEIIWVKTKCNNYYKLVSKLSNTKIDILDIEKRNKEVLLKLYKKDLKKLKKYIVSYKFIEIKKTGIYSILNILHINKLYLIITICSVILFCLVKNVAVDVDVMHSNANLKLFLEKELYEYGVKPLSIKKSYEDLVEIKSKILEEYPDKIDWLEIEVIGMKYVVKFEERIITEEKEEESYCNIYANSDGLIKSMSIFSGVAAVSVGDYVKKGDLLISGDIIYNSELKASVCAKGNVYVEKWYDVSVSIPYEYFEEEKTGKMRYNFFISHNNKETKILQDRIENYESKDILIFDLFGYELYLEKQYEIKRIYKSYTEEEILNEAKSLALEKINMKISDNESILSEKVLKKVENNSTIEVEIFIVTEELIS